MRQRTRADWRVLVYQYWVRLEHETWSQLPDGVKQEEEAMRSLWNELVDVFAQRQATYQQLLSSLPNVADCQAKVQVLHQHAYQTAAALKAARRQLKRRTHPQLTPLEAANTHAHTAFRDAQAALQEARRAAAATMRPALRALHQSFFAATKHVVAHCAVTWPNREFLLGKFLITIDRFFKNKGGPPQRKVGEPRTVHFHHRFTSGGLPVAHLSGHSRRLHIEPVPRAAFDPALPQRQRKRLARTSGIFQIGNTTLSFHTLLHRPLPEGAYIKTADLVGRQQVAPGYHQHQEGGHALPARWLWSLHLTLEVPPRCLYVQDQRTLTAVLNLGYRVWDENQLRVAVLVDSASREESLFLPATVLQAWRHRRSLQRQIDGVLEDTKATLRSLYGKEVLPAAASDLLAHVETLRAPALWRLLHMLEEANATGEVLTHLQSWADRSTQLRREARGVEKRYLGHRQWWYRNLALRLCRSYQRLVIQALDLRAIASRERENKEPRLRGAAKYRQLAALSQFLSCLRQAAAKTGTEIQEVNPAHPPSCAKSAARRDGRTPERSSSQVRMDIDGTKQERRA